MAVVLFSDIVRDIINPIERQAVLEDAFVEFERNKGRYADRFRTAAV